MSAPADLILSRLEKVKPRTPGSWIACCPAHEDRTPSLSVRETAEGIVLLKCFAGCGAADIVQAVGLELADLFPPQTEGIHACKAKHKPPVPWRDVIRALRHHLSVVAIGAQGIAAGNVLDEQDLLAVCTAAQFALELLAEVEDTHYA